MTMTARKLKTGLITGALCAGLALVGCSGGTPKSTADEAPAGGSESAEKTLTLHRSYELGHRDNSYVQVVVATAEDGTILATSVDEYEFMATDTPGLVPVPNAEAGFGEMFVEGKVLASKTINNEVYSKKIQEKAGSTQTWRDSMDAIEQSSVGKMADDLSKSGADTISGATLMDTPIYVDAIVAAAKNTAITTTGTYTGDGTDLKIGTVLEAAHGDKAFTSAVTVVQGDTIVASSIDEFQFLASSTEGIVPVPNSDAGLAPNIVEGMVLISKSLNSPVYSKMIADKAGSTQEWLTSMEAIEESLVGMKVEDAGSMKADTITGATLVDTPNYQIAGMSAAQAAK